MTLRCGAPYIPASERAAAAIAANPGKSDRAIAAEIGTSPTTVGKARRLTGQSIIVKRTGRDGKVRKMPKTKAAPANATDCAAIASEGDRPVRARRALIRSL